jgi:acyl-CoA thioester hydrolase
MQEPDCVYRIEFGVRDYECDLQGVVNNANYLHYLEHARHEYLISKGISFSRLHDEGTDLIITKVEIEYKFPLRSHDRFVVTIAIVKEGHVRIAFYQNIYRMPDNKLIARAKITSAATKNGKPFVPASLIKELGLE